MSPAPAPELQFASIGSGNHRSWYWVAWFSGRALVAVAVWAIIGGPLLAAGPTLRDANLKIAYADMTTCQVEARFSVVPGTATTLEHRLQLFDGSTVEVLDISGADLYRPAYVSGRTQVLELRPGSPTLHSYTLRYRVGQPADRAYRCPLWLPVAPSDGRSLNVEVGVALPAGAAAAGAAFRRCGGPGLEAIPGWGTCRRSFASPSISKINRQATPGTSVA